MKRTFILSVLLLLSAVSSAKIPGLGFEYGLDGEFRFDNREFAKSDDKIAPSMTIGAIVLTPSVGAGISSGDKAKHTLMAGVDLRRDFGSEQTTDVFREITLWYGADVNLKKGNFKGVAGVFPRRFLEGEYSEAFWSDSLKFQDPNMDGVLLKYRSSTFFAELGLDWMGMSGYDRKERFEIFSSLLWNVRDWLSVGMTAMMYHYAGSDLAPGVVDNHKLNPYVRIDAASLTGMQELSLKAGPMLTYQWDRERDEKPVLPSGAEFVLTAKKWNVSIRNTAYAGRNLMYYYDGKDTGGFKYGNNLYRGLQFYRGFFDIAEVCWAPSITGWLHFTAGARFYFNADGYLGCRQVVSLVFDI